MKKIKLTKNNILIISILMLSAFLNFFNISIEGYANEYYSAGVKSMLMNFKNFFFVSFDPGGFVSIDKPPLGFWIQTISAYIFGFHGWSVILPQAIAGVISVWLVYYLVKKSFNVAAGLISALVLAVTPVFVATSRNNTIDNLLILFLLLACVSIMKAAEEGSLKYLIICMVLIGLGFNIKMLQAYMIIPAVYLVYLFSNKLKVKKRIAHLLIGTVILVTVSLSWAIVVDMVPSTERPYVGSSTNNSVMELIIDHNGLKRLGLDSLLKNNSSSSSVNNKKQIMNNGKQQGKTTPNNSFKGNGSFRANAKDAPVSKQGSFAPKQSGVIHRQGGFTHNQSESAGIFRLFGSSMSDQISWFLPLALLGFIAAAIKEKMKFKFDNNRKLSLLLWISWLMPVSAYFSFTKGLFHNYYLSMLAPPIAALVGIGISALWNQYNEQGIKKWFLPIALAINGIVQILILSYDKIWGRSLIPIVAMLCFGSSIVLLSIQLIRKPVKKSIKKVFAVMCMVSLLISPTLWSFTPMLYGEQGGMPSAGPNLSNKRSGNEETFSEEKLITFLENNKKDEKYLVAVPSAQMMGSSLILKTGEPVMALGGFGGRDNILTISELKKLVDEGVVRYFLIQDPTRSTITPNRDKNSELEIWIKNNGVLVPEEEWKDENQVSKASKNINGRVNLNNSLQLYDLNPKSN